MADQVPDIQIIVTRDGRVAVDINLPNGQTCDETDELVRVMGVAIGLLPRSALDDIALPDEQAVQDKTTVRG